MSEPTPERVCGGCDKPYTNAAEHEACLPDVPSRRLMQTLGIAAEDAFAATDLPEGERLGLRIVVTALNCALCERLRGRPFEDEGRRDYAEFGRVLMAPTPKAEGG